MTHTKTLQQMVRTEIGSFPPDWPIRRLDQIAGGVSVGLVINPSTYFSERGTVPMLLGSQVTPNKIDHGAAKRITSQSNTKIPASILRAGDLITVRVGDPGTTAVIPDELDGCNCASMMIIRRAPSFNSAWLSHLLNSPVGSRQVANVQYGTAQKQFNIGDAVGFLFPVPPKSEQDAISKALSDTDTLIDSLEQMLTKKRQIKQGAMQELLTGKRRLPGFEQPWISRAFADVASFGRERVNPSALNSPPLCVELEHLEPGTGRLSGDAFESQQAATKSVFQRGDVLFGKLRAYLRKYWLADFDGVCSTEIWVLRARGELGSNAYLFYTIQRDDFISVASTAYGTHMPRSDWKIVGEFDLALPSDTTEQVAIAEVLSNMDSEIAALESRLSKARALKQAMAQALLTGRIRLVEPTA